MGKTYYWLKLNQEWFNQKHIKKLRKIAGGDTYTCIYLKMLLKSLGTDGKLYCDGYEENMADEIALDIDEDADNVEITLNYLKSYGLVEFGTDDVKMLEVDAMTGKETDGARRVRKHREKQKMLQCNNDVTFGNTEIELEKELDIDKRRDRIDYRQIADMYNETCVSFPKLRSLSDSRKKAIKARMRQYTVEDFKELFERAEHSSFLKGSNNRNWSATFDWLIKDSNMAKVLDGNFDDFDYTPKEKEQEETYMDSGDLEELLRKAREGF